MPAAKGKISGGSAQIGGDGTTGEGFHVGRDGHASFRVGEPTSDIGYSGVSTTFSQLASLQRPTFTGTSSMTGSRTGITKDTTNTEALQQLDQWLETYLVDSPPPPTPGDLIGLPTQIEVPWTNIPQQQLAFLDGTYTPYVHEMLVQYIPKILYVDVLFDTDGRLLMQSYRSNDPQLISELQLTPARTYIFSVPRDLSITVKNESGVTVASSSEGNMSLTVLNEPRYVFEFVNGSDNSTETFYPGFESFDTGVYLVASDCDDSALLELHPGNGLPAVGSYISRGGGLAMGIYVMSHTVSNKVELSANVKLDAGNVVFFGERNAGIVPTGPTINGKPLRTKAVLSAGSVSATSASSPTYHEGNVIETSVDYIIRVGGTMKFAADNTERGVKFVTYNTVVSTASAEPPSRPTVSNVVTTFDSLTFAPSVAASAANYPTVDIAVQYHAKWTHASPYTGWRGGVRPFILGSTRSTTTRGGTRAATPGDATERRDLTQYEYAQLGADIDGEATGDQSGTAVAFSSDGTVVAIGAVRNDGTASDAGHVRVFQYVGAAWSQLGNDIDGEAAQDQSGFSVSLSADGSVVAIGAVKNDGTGSNAGHVRVFQYGAGTWAQLGGDIDGEAAEDQSGFSVSLSADGSVVAIGAEGNDGTASNAGHVRVFQYGAGTWAQLGGDIDGEAANDQSGYSVSLSSDGSMVAIGKRSFQFGLVRVYQYETGTWAQLGNDIVGGGNNFGQSVSLSADGTRLAAGKWSHSGGTRVYQLSSNSWTQLGATIMGESAGDGSKFVSLSSDGNVLAIGAPGNHGTGSHAGHVRVFQYGAGTWAQIGSDIDGEAQGDQSGWSVSLSADGTRIAVGATRNDDAGQDAGHVRVFALPAAASAASESTGDATPRMNLTQYDYAQLGADIDGNTVSGQSGWSVSLSSDGTVVAIGAGRHDRDGGEDGGTVRVYQYISDGWVQLGDEIDGETSSDRFGRRVSLSADGSILAVGAFRNDGAAGQDAGHVRVYRFVDGRWVQLGNDIDGEASGDYSGYSVSLSSDGTVVAVGAPRNGDAGINSGHVRMFQYGETGWTQLGGDIDGESAIDISGWSVSLSSDGSVVAIGALYADGEDAVNAGDVRVFQYLGTDWVQLGDGMYGTAQNQSFGSFVSLNADGRIVAIGDGSPNGGARVYQLSSNIWTQVGATIASEAAGDGAKSVSLSSDGSVLAIGASRNDGVGLENVGHVRVYQLIGEEWAQIGRDIDGEEAYDLSGGAISLSSDGTVVAIGATRNDGAGQDAGHVRVFALPAAASAASDDAVVKTGAAAATSDDAGANAGAASSASVVGPVLEYLQVGGNIQGEAKGDQFGQSVSLSEDGMRLAVGATHNDGNGINAGHVRVYARHLAGTDAESWQQIGGDIDGEAGADLSGTSVSLNTDGSVLAIGALRNGAAAGHVRIYQYVAQSWTQMGSDIDGEANGDLSGGSVTLNSDGTIVAIGAVANDAVGHVRVYQYSGSGWAQLGGDIDGEAASDQFGSSVSLSSDGGVVAIGAMLHSNGGLTPLAGYVTVFQYSSHSWTQLGNSIRGQPYQLAGCSVSLNAAGSVLAIGCPGNDGQVMVLHLVDDVWISSENDLFGEEGFLSGFGYSVSLSSHGDVLAVGARLFDCGMGADCGRVLVYENDLFSTTSSRWTQIASIDGEAAYDEFGGSVSLSSDGRTLAAGGRKNNDASGHVRVYAVPSAAPKSTPSLRSYSSIDTLKTPDDPSDNFGRTVAYSGDGTTMAVGATRGGVVVYKFDTAWSETHSFPQFATVGDVAASDTSVALNATGTVLAVGTKDYDLTGRIMVYNLTNEGIPFGAAWYDVGQADARLGVAVSLNDNGNVLAVGGADAARVNGFAKVYVKNSGNVWQAESQPFTSDEQRDMFGQALALSSDGQILAIGAARHNEMRGLIQVFQRTGDMWVKTHDIQGPSKLDRYGHTVSINASGTMLASGTFVRSAVRIFNIESDGSYEDTLITGELGEGFGRSVSLNSIGNLVAIGATTPFNEGRVAIYEKLGGTWEHVADISPPSTYSKLFAFFVSLQPTATSDQLQVAVCVPQAGSDFDSGSGRVELFAVDVSSTTPPTYVPDTSLASIELDDTLGPSRVEAGGMQYDVHAVTAYGAVTMTHVAITMDPVSSFNGTVGAQIVSTELSTAIPTLTAGTNYTLVVSARNERSKSWSAQSVQTRFQTMLPPNPFEGTPSLSSSDGSFGASFQLAGSAVSDANIPLVFPGTNLSFIGNKVALNGDPLNGQIVSASMVSSHGIQFEAVYGPITLNSTAGTYSLYDDANSLQIGPACPAGGVMASATFSMTGGPSTDAPPTLGFKGFLWDAQQADLSVSGAGAYATWKLDGANHDLYDPVVTDLDPLRSLSTSESLEQCTGLFRVAKLTPKIDGGSTITARAAPYEFVVSVSTRKMDGGTVSNTERTASCKLYVDSLLSAPSVDACDIDTPGATKPISGVYGIATGATIAVLTTVRELVHYFLPADGLFIGNLVNAADNSDLSAEIKYGRYQSPNTGQIDMSPLEEYLFDGAGDGLTSFPAPNGSVDAVRLRTEHVLNANADTDSVIISGTVHNALASTPLSTAAEWATLRLDSSSQERINAEQSGRSSETVQVDFNPANTLSIVAANTLLYIGATHKGSAADGSDDSPITEINDLRDGYNVEVKLENGATLSGPQNFSVSKPSNGRQVTNGKGMYPQYDGLTGVGVTYDHSTSILLDNVDGYDTALMLHHGKYRNADGTGGVNAYMDYSPFTIAATVTQPNYSSIHLESGLRWATFSFTDLVLPPQGFGGFVLRIHEPSMWGTYGDDFKPDEFYALPALYDDELEGEKNNVKVLAKVIDPNNLIAGDTYTTNWIDCNRQAIDVQPPLARYTVNDTRFCAPDGAGGLDSGRSSSIRVRNVHCEFNDRVFDMANAIVLVKVGMKVHDDACPDNVSFENVTVEAIPKSDVQIDFADLYPDRQREFTTQF